LSGFFLDYNIKTVGRRMIRSHPSGCGLVCGVNFVLSPLWEIYIFTIITIVIHPFLIFRMEITYLSDERDEILQVCQK
jgi:hypothetical protein